MSPSLSVNQAAAPPVVSSAAMPYDGLRVQSSMS